MAEADYSVWVPPMTLNRLERVSAKVMASNNGQVGMSDSASDIFFLGPAHLAARTWLADAKLEPVGAVRRDGSTLEDVMASVEVVDGSTIWYNIRSPSLRAWHIAHVREHNEDPEVTVRFHTTSRTLTEFTTTLTGGFDVEGKWTQVTDDNIRAFETGKVWVSLTVEGVRYSGLPELDERSGSPIVIRLPVSVSMAYGDVYHWPDTEAARLCIENADESTGCNLLRRKVDGATIKDGEARFAVGASQTRPAGGYYQVSQGSNVPLIVGIAVACFIFALTLVGSAVYFRKHPQKWTSVRAWGPRKYKAIKRSLASSV
jgi:hypothetical protein